MTFEELRIAAQKIYKEVLAADEERKNDKTIERLAELSGHKDLTGSCGEKRRTYHFA